MVLTCSTLVSGQDAAEMEIKAQQDVKLGLEGLKSMASNPALLAQLLEDMKDPEMMAAAKAMMENPAYKKNMEAFQNSAEFKESVKKTKEAMEDPDTAARLQAQVEHMAMRGKDDIKKNAMDSMSQAMGALSSDPAVLDEAKKLAKDPDFIKNLQEMAKDPAFKNYIDAMGEMMKDPEKKAQVEQVKQKLKAEGIAS